MKIMTLPLMLVLIGMACIAPARAQVQVLAPAWAYQLQVGMRLSELRTVAGKQYFGVTIEALDTMQIQFTHSQGRRVEYLVSIRDPNTYATAPAPQNNARQEVGPLAAMMSAQNRAATGVDKLNDDEQMTLKNWLPEAKARFPTSTGLNDKLTAQERSALSYWLNHKRAELIPAVAAEMIGQIHVPLDSYIAGDFVGFELGRVYRLSNHQAWKQIDRTAMSVYPDASHRPVKVHIRAAGGDFYFMSVQGVKGEIMVKPVVP